MRLERQPDALPTNKAVTGSAVAAIIVTYAQPLAAEIWPQVAPAIMAGPVATQVVAALVGALAGLAAAWWVPDRAGVAA